MFRKTWIMAIMGAVLTAATALGATFGTVVPIGGQAADIALDEPRGVLYIANFSANQIDVMSLANNTIQTSINVDPNPSSISVSPDDHWLIVAHFGNNTSGSQTNELTLIDLTANYSQQVIALGNPPLGVAFGADDNALVVTTNEFIQFNPTVGTTTTLQTIAQVATNAIPQPTATFPNQFAQASLAVSRDGYTIAGFGGTSPYLLFRYNVGTKVITSAFYVSSPPAGPRVVSLADDGSFATFAWWVADSNLVTSAQWGNPVGLLNVGSTVIDSSRSLIYAQIPPSGTPATANTNPPILMINDSDNLTVEDQLNLPENLAGKSVLTNDHNTMYAISDSGVTVLPVGNLASYPRLQASVQDIVFRGNFCNQGANSQTLVVSDPGGGSTPFTISSSVSGVSVSPSSGVTPAVVTVTVNAAAFASQKGTSTAALTISSSAAINLPKTVRVLINSQAPSQRGSFVDIPGTVADVLADPKRQVYYVLRQDVNQVLVYGESNNSLQSILRTCTTPTSMAITFDQQDLLVGCDNSHYMDVFDLDLLQAQTPINMGGDYAESIAASSNAILVMGRPGDGSQPGIDQVNMLTHSASRLPTLGNWTNQLSQDTVLSASSNGANILAAGADGSVLIYNAVAGTFVSSRHDFGSLGGAYAASNFSQFMVGNTLLDNSGVPHMALSTANGSSSGFSFVNQNGYFTTAPNSASPGVIEQVNTANGTAIQPTAMVEAPILSSVTAPSTGTNCTTTTTTSSTGTMTVTTCVTGNLQTVTTQSCTVSGSTTTCTSNSQTGTIASPSAGLFARSYNSAFTRTLAPMPDQSEIVALTTSGFTVLPWAYAASVAAPQISSVVSAADGVSPAAPGGLVSIFGSQMNPTNLATSQIPLPTALANSCVTVNGQPMPLVFVSPTQINAQMPSEAVGAVTVNVYTPGGESNNFNITVQPTAPAVFMSGTAGPETNLPTIVRDANGQLVTDTNPIHRGDALTIYLTGLGETAPVVGDGLPAPVSPLAIVVQPPTVQLGGVNVPVTFAGLAPGQVGVGQINVTVPSSVPEGLNTPLTITQGGAVQSLSLRVID